MMRINNFIFKMLIIIFVINIKSYTQIYTEITTNCWGEGLSHSRPTFTDLDDDDLLDFFIGDNRGNVIHYEQSSSGSTTFNLITKNFNNIDVGSMSSPAFTDLDDDGLLDLLIGEDDGNLNHYEQSSSGSSTFNLVTDSFNSISVAGFAVPTFTDLDNDGLLDLIIGSWGSDIKHYEQSSSGSTTFNLVSDDFCSFYNLAATPTFTDLDNDGLLDLLIGRYSGAIAHYEQSSSGSITFDLVTEYFSLSFHGYDTAPVFTDLDNDGLLDLLIGEHDGNINHFEQSASGSTTFNLATESFAIIDVGRYSTPTFTDLDNDGLLDLLIGEEIGNINHFEQSSSSSTIFNLHTENFNSILMADQITTPTFTDMDNDGLMDLLIGGYSAICHYEQSSYASTTFNLVIPNFNSIVVPPHATPICTDLDNDGLLDLLIGAGDGTIHHYEQNSSGSTTFDLVTENFNSIMVEDAAPAFTDLDNDGLLDLLIGAGDGTVHHYEQSPSSYTTFDLLTENFNSIAVTENAKPTFADLDSDGWIDLFVGESRGGIVFFKRIPGIIYTQNASDISSSSATLNGNINPAGTQMNVIFELGTTTSYGETLIADPASVNGNTDISVSVNISELTANQLYHFRVVAYNGDIVLTGEDQTFITAPDSPELVAPVNNTTGIPIDPTLS